MSTAIFPTRSAKPATTIDFEALKQRQQATWASGDFAVIGTTLQIEALRVAAARAEQCVLSINP
jgi:hypothetical protein